MNETNSTSCLTLKLDPLWFSDIKIERNCDLNEYVPILEDQVLSGTINQFILRKFGEIVGFNPENTFIDNNFFLKINHWAAGKKMIILLKIMDLEPDMMSISIFLPVKNESIQECC